MSPPSALRSGLAALGRALSSAGWPRAPARPCRHRVPSPPPAAVPEPEPVPAPGPPRDYAVPNGAWGEPMRRHYRRLLALAATGPWVRLPSYRRARHHLGGDIPLAPAAAVASPPPPGDTRLFLRAIDGEGAGFEYAMFLNRAERRLLCLAQPGPYLEGHPGLTHGGAIATILDAALGTCALAVAGTVVTANLSIDYVAPVPLGTALLVDARAGRLEGRKVFLGGSVRGADGDTLYAEATGLFIRLDPGTPPAREGDGGR